MQLLKVVVLFMITRVFINHDYIFQRSQDTFLDFEIFNFQEYFLLFMITIWWFFKIMLTFSFFDHVELSIFSVNLFHFWSTTLFQDHYHFSIFLRLFFQRSRFHFRFLDFYWLTQSSKNPLYSLTLYKYIYIFIKRLQS